MMILARWNHNEHYHRFILAQLPLHVGKALDVGCGNGSFAALLAGIADGVDAVDIDIDTVGRARLLQSEHTNLVVRHADFMTMEIQEGYYDAVSSLASIHHMEFGEALTKMAYVLRPGGTLVILGLYKESSVADYLTSMVAVPANLLHLILDYRCTRFDAYSALTKPATMTFSEVRTISGQLPPGAQLRRHLYWRYSLVWRKPGLGN